jgi:hypothetical protein
MQAHTVTRSTSVPCAGTEYSLGSIGFAVIAGKRLLNLRQKLGLIRR